jgi:phosphomannomutase
LSKEDFETLTITKEYFERYNTAAFIRAAEEYKTAGIRGLIGKVIEEGVINLYNVRLYAQARSEYIKKHYPPEKQAIFIGRDERLFSKEFSFELARVYAGNNIRVFISEQSTSCPITSYTGWIYGIPADLVSSSHNRATREMYFNGIKPSSDSGGLISENETDEIIDRMKDICANFGHIRIAPLHHPLIQTIDPIPDYIRHLRNNLSENDIKSIKEAGEKGLVKTYWATYGGAAGPALERINNDIFGKGWDSFIRRLHWMPDFYFHGYGENPDPSDPAALKDMFLKEGIIEELIKGRASYAQATDGDGDRVGLMVRCPDNLIREALNAGLIVYNSNGECYSDKDYAKGKEAVVCMLPYQIFILLTFMRLQNIQIAGQDTSSYVIITSHATPYFEKIADKFNCKLIHVPVGFRWLNFTASQIEANREYVEIDEIHWRDDIETIRHHVGLNRQIVVICEESGGMNFGNYKEESNKIGNRSKIAKEKDGSKAFMIVLLEASRLAQQGKSLIEMYIDMLSRPGFGNSYFNRTDLSLISASGTSIKEGFMNFYTDLFRRYRNTPDKYLMEGVPAKHIYQAGDGVKIILENGSWLYVRPSGTEPKLKIFTWGKTSEEANILQNAVKKHKEQILH